MNLGDTKSPILLVESDAKDEMDAVRAYEETGHTNRLLVARTAENALTLLKACSRGLRFGLVLVDLYTPRLGTPDLVRRIRRESSLSDIPVVVLAPDHVSERQLCTLADVANSWARKPSTRMEYCHLLNRLIQVFLGVTTKNACGKATPR